MSICKWFKKKKKKKETLKYDGLQNVVIEDKSFEGGDVQLFLTNCDGITIKGCDFTGVNSENGHAILIHNSRNIEIVDCTFSNMVVGNSEVVALHACTSFEIHKNYFHGADNIFIDIISGEINSNMSHGGTIHNNFLDYKDLQRTDYWTAAIYCDSAWNVDIYDNTIIGSSLGVEIGSEHEGLYSKNCDVYDNKFKDISKHAIIIGSYKKTYGGARFINHWGNEFENVENEYLEQENVK